MAFIPTGFLSGLSNVFSSVTSTIGDVLSSDIGAGFLNLGTQLAVQRFAPQAGRSAGLPQPGGVGVGTPFAPMARTTGHLAMPGGAPLAHVSTSLPVAGGGNGGGLMIPGGGACPPPAPTTPRILQRINPCHPNLVDTWVRAPRTRYKVTISGPRRCRKR